MKRREFIQSASTCAAGLAGFNFYEMTSPCSADALNTGGGIGIAEGLYILEKGKEKNRPVEVRQEIRNNPDAVFLIETHVDASPDERGFFSEAALQLETAGKETALSLFTGGSSSGGSTLVKPNFTYVAPEYMDRTCGVITSPDFVAGFVEGLIELGNTNVIVGERVGGGARNHRQTGIYRALDEKNISLLEAAYAEFSHYEKKELNWRETRGSLVWKRIPCWRPIGDPDTTFINIAKLKNHDIGITTLSVKNLQGAVPTGYGHFCDPWAKVRFHSDQWGVNFRRDFYEDYRQRVEASFQEHLKAGYKNLDYFGVYRKYLEKGGWDTFRKIKDNPQAVDEFLIGKTGWYNAIDDLMRFEQWFQRGLDNAAVLKPALNIIEGIIGMEGYQHGSLSIGRDRLCNIVIAGISAVHVDTIGTYIMGHEPSEVLYLRAARERGLGECDARMIPLYRIQGGEIVPVENLAEIKRFRLGVSMDRAKPEERVFW